MDSPFDLRSERWPSITWSPSALDTKERLLEFLRKHAEPDSARKVYEELCAQLDYLENYSLNRDTSTRTWRVFLFGDRGFDFQVLWKHRTTPGTSFNGVLQCDAVPQPFGSVNIGEVSMWSIHT